MIGFNDGRFIMPEHPKSLENPPAGHVTLRIDDSTKKLTLTNENGVDTPVFSGEAGWTKYYGSFVRNSTTQITITGVDVTNWKGFGLKINGTISNIVTAAVISGSDTVITVRGVSLPATITSIHYTNIDKMYLAQAEFIDGELNIITTDLFAKDANRTTLKYVGTQGRIVDIEVYCYNKGTNPNGCVVNANVNTNANLLATGISIDTGYTNGGVNLQNNAITFEDTIKGIVSTASGNADIKSGRFIFKIYVD